MASYSYTVHVHLFLKPSEPTDPSDPYFRDVWLPNQVVLDLQTQITSLKKETLPKGQLLHDTPFT